MLEIDQSLVQFGIKRGKVVQETLSAEPLGEEKLGKDNVDQDTLVHGLAKNSSNEPVPI
jgi:hypothetical protein